MPIFFNSYVYAAQAPDGTYKFSRIIDSTAAENGYAVAVDTSDNFYFGGSYSLTPNIFSESGTILGTLPTSNVGVTAAFMSKFSSNGAYQYSRVVVGASSCLCYGLTTDSGSNVYMYGTYAGTPPIRDESGNILFTLPNLSVALYVLKFNSSGTFQWARMMQNPNAWPAFQCAVDSQNNLYMGGYLNATGTIFDENRLSLGTVVSAGSVAGYAAKFNASGTLLFSLCFNSPAASDGVLGIAVDSTSNVAFAGYYGANGTMNIIRRTGTTNATIGILPVTAAGIGAFVVKMDPNGNILHSFVLDSAGTDYVQGVTFDTNLNMYFGGFYTGTPTLNVVSSSNIASIVTTFPASSGSAAYLVKVDASNVFQYARIIDSAGGDQTYGIAMDSTNAVYMSGLYNGTPTIKDQSNTTLGTLPIRLGTGNAGFSCKFDSSGTYLYSRIIDATNVNDAGFSIACDSKNSMYLTTTYNGTPTIKDQSNTTLGTLLTSLGSSTACISKF